MADFFKTDGLYRQNKFNKTLELFTKNKTGAMRTTSVGGKKFEIFTLLRPSFVIADV